MRKLCVFIETYLWIGYRTWVRLCNLVLLFSKSKGSYPQKSIGHQSVPAMWSNAHYIAKDPNLDLGEFWLKNPLWAHALKRIQGTCWNMRVSSVDYLPLSLAPSLSLSLWPRKYATCIEIKTTPRQIWVIFYVQKIDCLMLYSFKQ